MRTLLITLTAAAAVSAQPLAYTISTIAGGSNAFEFAEGKPATSFLIRNFFQPAIDRQGNFYFSLGNRVVRVAPDGTARTYAGTGQAGFGGDTRPATSALLNAPSTLLFDTQGRLVIFDAGNNRIRRVEPTGVIGTIAGAGQVPPGPTDADGSPATSARVHTSAGTYDASGNLFLIDFPADFNSNLRRIGADGRITTVAQKIGVFPWAMASDGTNVYVSDLNPQVNRVSRLTSTGLAAVTGNTIGFSGDGRPANASGLMGPYGIAVDSAGNLHIADSGDNRIRTVHNSPPSATAASGLGLMGTSAGTGTSDFGVDGASATASTLSNPQAMAADSADNIYFSDNGSGRFRKFKLNGTIQTVAGLAYTDPLGDGGPAAQSALLAPGGLFRDSNGNLLLADAARLRQITPDGNIATVAGRGVGGEAPDGQAAVKALLNGVVGGVRDSAGNLYVLEGGAVLKVNPDGTITKIVGFAGAKQDEGPAAQVTLGSPESMIIDAQDDIFIGSFKEVKKLSPDGTVTRVLGSPLFNVTQAPSGDARTARISIVLGLARDASGNLFVSDTAYSRVLKVTPAGQFTTAVGGATGGFAGDSGAAAQALLNTPGGLAFDAWGNLYIADTGNSRIRRVASDGTISTIAGADAGGAIADGASATSAPLSLSLAQALVADPAGNLLLVESNRVRQITPDKLRTSGVVHAATSATGPVAAGLRVKISGAELIPPNAASDAVQVLFDGQPADYSSNDGAQIVAVVPAALAGNSSTQMRLAIRGAQTNALTLPVVQARPGILGILNADGTANGDGSPASAGSMVALLETGDGNADPSTLAVMIGGEMAQVMDASPSGTPGVRQVTVQLPDDVVDGAAVVIAVAGAVSQDGVVVRVE